MQVLLRSDQPSSPGMAEHLQTVVSAALGRFGERVTRVEAHLHDADGTAKAGANVIGCTLLAGVVGEPDVVVSDHAGSAHQAIDGALRKLKRAVGAALAQQHPHRPSPRSLAASA